MLFLELYTNNRNTVEPLLWDSYIQGIPPFRGYKICSRKNVHIIFLSLLPQYIQYIEETPLFTGKGDFFWVQKAIDYKTEKNGL